MNDDKDKFIYALNIEYVKNIIKQERSSFFVGDLGIFIHLIESEKAKLNFNYLSNNNFNKTKLMTVSSVVPGLNSFNKLFFGDILLKINGTEIYNNFVFIDSILNKFNNSNIDLLVSRNGELKNISIEVKNSQTYNSDKYLVLNKNIFIQELTQKLKYDFDSDVSGIIFNIIKGGEKVIERNTYFRKKSILKSENINYVSSVIITRINSIKIENLENFKLFLTNNCQANNLILEGISMKSKSSYYSTIKLKINSSLLNERIYDYNIGKWIDLMNYNFTNICQNGNKQQFNENNYKNSENAINYKNNDHDINNKNDELNKGLNNVNKKNYSKSDNSNENKNNIKINYSVDITNYENNKSLNDMSIQELSVNKLKNGTYLNATNHNLESNFSIGSMNFTNYYNLTSNLYNSNLNITTINNNLVNKSTINQTLINNDSISMKKLTKKHKNKTSKVLNDVFIDQKVRLILDNFLMEKEYENY